jgi:excisionase family DNA binding protein
MNEILQQLTELTKLIKIRIPGDWMSIKDVMEMSKLSDSTIRRAIRTKSLKYRKTTGKYLFKRNWVEEWLNT